MGERPFGNDDTSCFAIFGAGVQNFYFEQFVIRQAAIDGIQQGGGDTILADQNVGFQVMTQGAQMPDLLSCKCCLGFQCFHICKGSSLAKKRNYILFVSIIANVLIFHENTFRWIFLKIP
jgi:hypothetical protein